MSPAVTLTAQVTLLLLLALGLAWLGRRGSSRTLHQLWTATFALVLVLPLLGLLAPSWNVPILPARGGEPQPSSVEVPVAVEAAAATPRLIPAARGSEVPNPGAVSRPAGVGQPTRSSPSLVRVLFIAWALGCAISLISLAAGAWRRARLYVRRFRSATRRCGGRPTRSAAGCVFARKCNCSPATSPPRR